MKHKATNIGTSFNFIGRFLSELEISQLVASEVADYSRDNETLREIGKGHTSVALHSQGVYLSRVGSLDEAENSLLTVARIAPPPLQAKALLTLGTVNLKRGELGAAELFYARAARLACDPITALQCTIGRAILLSTQGKHREALSELERCLLLTRILTPSHPIRLNFYNSAAVELVELGHVEQARSVIVPAIASPFAGVYPEWQETANDERLSRGRRLIAVPTGRLQTASVIQFPVPTRSESEQRMELQFQAMRTLEQSDKPLLETVVALGKTDAQHVDACRQLLDSTPLGLEISNHAAKERDEEFLRSILQVWHRAKERNVSEKSKESQS